MKTFLRFIAAAVGRVSQVRNRRSTQAIPRSTTPAALTGRGFQELYYLADARAVVLMDLWEWLRYCAKKCRGEGAARSI